MHLHFMRPADALDSEGRLTFEAHPLERLGDVGGSPEALAAFKPDLGIQIHPSWTDYWLNQSGVRVSVAVQDDPDGPATFYCVRSTLVAEDIIKLPNKYYRRWQIYRMRSGDGRTIDQIEHLFDGPEYPPFEGGRWLTGYWMARNSGTGSLHYYMYAYDPEKQRGSGLHNVGLYEYASVDDGHTWSSVSDQSVFPVNHDNVCVMWDPRGERFVAQQVTTHPQQGKPFVDNAGRRRRILEVWSGKPGEPFEYQTTLTPDSDDASDVEFYRVSTFPYGDRFVALANIYAASPLRPNVHGPHLRCEWWVSDDCVHWERPWRSLNAEGGAPYTIESAPVVFGGRMLWWINEQIWGLPVDRIAGVGAQSNGAFTTHPFAMPQDGLTLNASLPARPRFFDQNYVMVELVDEYALPIPGYEAEKCLLTGADDLAIPLRWEGKTGAEFAGRKVAVRFRFRGARIYALNGA